MKTIFYPVSKSELYKKLRMAYNSGLLAQRAAIDAYTVLQQECPQDTPAMEQVLRDYEQVTVATGKIEELLSKLEAGEKSMKIKACEIIQGQMDVTTIVLESIDNYFIIEIERGEEKSIFRIESSGRAMKVSAVGDTKAITVVPETHQSVLLVDITRPVPGTLG